MKDVLDNARAKINEIDEEMARLFVARMKAAEDIAEYKKENGMPITDASREKEILDRSASLIDGECYRGYYRDFQKGVMALSKKYQRSLIGEESCCDGVSVINVEASDSSYPVIVGNGILNKAAEYLSLQGRAVIITDDGVPKGYVDTVKNQCDDAAVITLPSGERTKSFAKLESILNSMSEIGLTRGDCVIAVGGGVVGDISGLAASLYMRGIDFYNVPTTLLAQVDSSIGGKTAVNLGAVKNAVGSFKQPKAVLVDLDTLSTLPSRHLRNGVCEAVKMAATLDSELFSLFESLSEEEIYANMRTIVERALKIKRAIVEKDEKESDARRVLNFGHTVGHAIESSSELEGLLHGECVAIGMMAMASGDAKIRIKSVLEKLGLPTKYEGDTRLLTSYIKHDKKAAEGGINAVFTDKIGDYSIRRVSVCELEKVINSIC